MNLNHLIVNIRPLKPPILFQTFRYSSYLSSKPVGDLKQYTSEYEVTKCPEEWKFVEQALSPKIIPSPNLKKDYPSGWKPQSENLKNLPYFIVRTKNFMQPIYLERTYHGMRRITNLKRIQGDIWKLEEELKKYIEQRNPNKIILSQVNEVCGQIKFKGDYVSEVKDWLSEKGF